MSCGTFQVITRERRYHGFLNVDEVTYEYRQLDGSPSGRKHRLVMERGHSAAILLLNTDKQAVVLVRQPRVAAATVERPDDGWLLELPAGVIEPIDRADPPKLEDPADAARREAYEETGYAVGQIRKITTVLPSPGGSSERIHIYFAAVKNADFDKNYEAKRPPNRKKDDYIEVVHLPLVNLQRLVDEGRILDAKLVIAAQWLRCVPSPNPALPPGELSYAWAADLREGEPVNKRHGPRVLGIQTGDIEDVENIDIWVNAENTDMQMARFFDKGVSAKIRYLGAAKRRDGTIHADTIADDLKRKLAGQVAVRPGHVVVTTSGDLRYTHNVEHIIHVACAQHSIGGKTMVDASAAADGLRRAMLEADYRSRMWRRRLGLVRPVRSMLTPLIGTGNAGGDPAHVARTMIPAAIKHFEKHPDSPFRKLFFVAYSKSEGDIIKEVLEACVAKGLLVLDGRFGVRREKTGPAVLSNPS